MVFPRLLLFFFFRVFVLTFWLAKRRRCDNLSFLAHGTPRSDIVSHIYFVFFPFPSGNSASTFPNRRALYTIIGKRPEHFLLFLILGSFTCDPSFVSSQHLLCSFCLFASTVDPCFLVNCLLQHLLRSLLH